MPARAKKISKRTVTAIVREWGYINFGIFADSYPTRFGELPSETIRMARFEWQR